MIMSHNDIKEFVHHEINQEVTAIGGHYVLTKEARIAFQGREILYMTGYAIFDTTCCGSGGCGYAIIPGFVKDWKIKQDKDGRDVTHVEPIKNPMLQKEIQAVIKKQEMVQEIRFE